MKIERGPMCEDDDREEPRSRWYCDGHSTHRSFRCFVA